MKYNLSIPHDRDMAQKYFDKLIAGDKRIELKQFVAKRSLRQNAYLHVVISWYACKFPQTIADAKYYLKTIHNIAYEQNGQRFEVSTASMNKMQLSAFIEAIRSHSLEQGEYIFTSEEYLINQFVIDKEIQQNEIYLNKH